MAAAQLNKPRASRTPTTRPCHVYAYLRVSTDTQQVDAQKVGIVDYVRAQGLSVGEWIEETAGGDLEASKRQLGQTLLPKLKSGDIFITTELSRLGRSTLDVLSTLKQLRDKQVEVHVVKGGLKLDDSLNSKILSTVLGLAAEIERELIRQRSIEGQSKARALGKRIGRPRIERDEDHHSKLDKRAEEIKLAAAKGIPKASLARFFDCNWGTMSEWLRRHHVTVVRNDQ